MKFNRGKRCKRFILVQPAPDLSISCTPASFLVTAFARLDDFGPDPKGLIIPVVVGSQNPSLLPITGDSQQSLYTRNKKKL